MTMEREYRVDPQVADDRQIENEPALGKTAADTAPAFRYAREDEAMATAERMMERYEDVLRELAK